MMLPCICIARLQRQLAFPGNILKRIHIQLVDKQLFIHVDHVLRIAFCQLHTLIEQDDSVAVLGNAA